LGRVTAPQSINSVHEINDFQCGIASLDEWLSKRALKNQATGASRTFVICDGARVVGYYALSSGSIERLLAPGALARNMPEPIPVIVLGRLAVDHRYQGRRLGAALLKDAIGRTLLIAEQVGVRALLVHALSDEAKQFYRGFNFIESPKEPMTLLLSIDHLKLSLES
jgi:predicted N-acetyltransferase YhbS